MEKERFPFILCQTRFASNLGSAARVLKNFGFSRLLLVNPKCPVGAEARTFAMRGAELLDDAQVLPNLVSARNQVDILVATRARSTRGRPRNVAFHDLKKEVFDPYQERRIGIVFGSEKNGLTGEELAQCDFSMAIPTDSDYPSLNLAQAVAVVAHHVHGCLLEPETKAPPPEHALSDAHWETFQQHLQELIARLALSEEMSQERILKRLTLLAARASLERQDVDLLLGLFRRIS